MILSCQIISNERERERPPRQRTTTITPGSYVQTNNGFALIHALRERERERVEAEIQCSDPCFFFYIHSNPWLERERERERERVEVEIQCSDPCFFFNIHSNPWLKRERGQSKREEEDRGWKRERERN